MNRFSPTIYTDRFSSVSGNTQKLQKVFKIRFRGAIGEFSGEKYPLEKPLNRSIDFHKKVYWLIQFNKDFAKQQILLAKISQFKPSRKDSKKLQLRELDL
jgi:hypothetical protein